MSLPHDLEPILPGFHPDPTICRVGDTYYLATSSFEYRPGVPLFRSTDLRSWEPVGHALATPDHFPEDEGWPSHGIYAPTLRHHDGKFWLTTTNVTPSGREQMILHATSIEGPWSLPVQTAGMQGIDPDLTWDGDLCYMTWTTSDPANPAILQARIDPLTARALEVPRVIWRGTGLAYPEAPHLYAKDGWWFLLLAEGGTERGHAMTMARGKSIEGPFEACPHNPIFSHRSVLHPIQNTGHGDLVQRPDGSWLIVFLGVRPRGGSPGFHTHGRESFIADVDWSADWPRIVAPRDPVRPTRTDFTDDFSSRLLHHRWICPGLFPQDRVQLTGTGCLLLPDKGQARPAMLLARALDPQWQAEVQLTAPTSGSTFLVRIDDSHWFGVEIGPRHLFAVLTLAGVKHALSQTPRPEGPLRMRMRTSPGGEGIGCPPDHITLSVQADGKWSDLARVDGRYLSTEVAGGFTGRVWGVSTTAEPLRLHSASYTGL